MPMKFHPDNTVAYYAASPQCAAINLSQIPVKIFAASTDKFMEGCSPKKVLPDDEALFFYGLNHCAAILRKHFTLHEPLSTHAAEVLAHYNRVLAEQSQRTLHYLLAIITREARHLHVPAQAKFWPHIEKAASSAFVDFIKHIRGMSEMPAVRYLIDNPPACTIGQYMDGMVEIFNKGKWGGGYGGKKWGLVAKCLADCMHGKTSMEMMVDTSYTLAHNNGPIFNKGMLYHQYSGQFVMILDIQRSGQIPEFVLGKNHWGFQVPSTLKSQFADFAQAYPNEFGDEVDWHKVEQLGSIQKYPSQIAKQVSAKKKEPETFIFGIPAKHTGSFDVFPGQAAQVYQREAH